MLSLLKNRTNLCRFCINSEYRVCQCVCASFRALVPSTDPVTKQTAGSSYHVLLARQLADFLLKVLATSAGMIMLIDVYCMFNRARSTELVSPDDVINS